MPGAFCNQRFFELLGSVGRSNSHSSEEIDAVSQLILQSHIEAARPGWEIRDFSRSYTILDLKIPRRVWKP